MFFFHTCEICLNVPKNLLGCFFSVPKENGISRDSEPSISPPPIIQTLTEVAEGLSRVGVCVVLHWKCRLSVLLAVSVVTHLDRKLRRLHGHAAPAPHVGGSPGHPGLNFQSPRIPYAPDEVVHGLHVAAAHSGPGAAAWLTHLAPARIEIHVSH